MSTVDNSGGGGWFSWWCCSDTSRTGTAAERAKLNQTPPPPSPHFKRGGTPATPDSAFGDTEHQPKFGEPSPVRGGGGGQLDDTRDRV